MFQTWDNSQLCTDSQYSSIVWSLKHQNTQSIYIFNRVRVLHLDRLKEGTWLYSFATTCLSSGLTRCFGFGGHGSLQLDGEAGIFAAKENGVTAHDLRLLYNCGIAWAWEVGSAGQQRWATVGSGGVATWCHTAARRAHAACHRWCSSVPPWLCYAAALNTILPWLQPHSTVVSMLIPQSIA